MTPLTTIQAEIRRVNVANGWHDEDRTRGEDRALIHSEISEALEAYRSHGLADVTIDLCGKGGAHSIDHRCKPEGVASELADVVIRLLDTLDRQEVAPWWIGEPIDAIIPFRVASARFGDWIDAMHTATARDAHELLIRTVAGAALHVLDQDTLEEEIHRKVAYNATRGHKHGGKRL